MPARAPRWSTLLLISFSGCAIDLENEADSASKPVAAPQLESCALLEKAADDVRGLATSVTLPDGTELLLAEASIDGSREATAFSGATSQCGGAARALEARPIIDVTELASDASATPRSGFTTDAAYLYFALSDANGFESSSGIARFDEDTGKFVGIALLWTSDRPSYGSSALVSGDFVYVYGGLAARFLAADVYLARAPLERVAEPSAYEYFSGGGGWTADADLARALLEGGQLPSVAWNAAHERFVMAYTTPLAREITVRSGLGPGGPWSLPQVLGACALPFEEAFCTGASHLPSFANEGGLALAQSVATFEAPAGATERDYWTQLVRAPWPTLLP